MEIRTGNTAITDGRSEYRQLTVWAARLGGPSRGRARFHGEASPYIVYRHFLARVNQLDKAATASGATDPYKFAEPFTRANLQHQHLDILRAEAQKLDDDLSQHQAKAQLIITKYRAEAKIAVSQGQPFPPVPTEVHGLDRQRVALLVNHYATFRAAYQIAAHVGSGISCCSLTACSGKLKASPSPPPAPESPNP